MIGRAPVLRGDQLRRVNAWGSWLEWGAVVRIFVETAFAPYLRLWIEAVANDLPAQSTELRELF